MPGWRSRPDQATGSWQAEVDRCLIGAAHGTGRPRRTGEPGGSDVLDDEVDSDLFRRALPELLHRQPRDRRGAVARDGLQPQSNAKENEGRQHEDRDAQFVHLTLFPQVG